METIANSEDKKFTIRDIDISQLIERLSHDNPKIILTKTDSECNILLEQLRQEDKSLNLVVVDIDVYQIQQKEKRELRSLEHRYELDRAQLEADLKLQAEKSNAQSKKEWFELIFKAGLTLSVFIGGIYFIQTNNTLAGNFLLGGVLYTLCQDYVIKFGKKLFGG